MTRPLRIAVTCGEPAGIGAETVWKALAGEPVEDCEFLLVGPGEVWRRSLELTGMAPARGAVIYDSAGLSPLDWEWGVLNPLSASAALSAVLTAARLAVSGEADALVTAPLTKEGLALAGSGAPGHTELLGEFCGRRPFMLFTARGMKVILVTTHLPLREVPDAITRENVLETIKAASQGLSSDFGIADPRVAVAGLNPHAGEHGKLGHEEARIIAPAVHDAVGLGIDATGPVPADALFAQLAGGRYDIAVAMYHDQGLAPFKMAHFNDGVNVTVGLPIVRTSPDHGTAFDIAGRGTANAESMFQALKTAAGIARRRMERKP